MNRITFWIRSSSVIVALMADDYDAFVDLAKSLTGFQDLDESWLFEVWNGADSNMNIAINHVLDGEKKRRPPVGLPARHAALRPDDAVMDPGVRQDAQRAAARPAAPEAVHRAVLMTRWAGRWVGRHQ